MTGPTIFEWHGYTFGFSLEGSNGKVELLEEGDRLHIAAEINEQKTQLGMLQAHYEEGQPDVVTFSAYSAAPNVRFKYLQVDITRQVPVPLLFSTAFYILCPDKVVQAVMLVDNSQ